MKKMLLSVLAIAAFTIVPACADDIAIHLNQLPKVAKQFLQQHFANNKAITVNQDRDINDRDYTVLLDDGTKIEFDAKGNWESVENKRSYVAESVIPDNIKAYISTTYPSLGIVKIERTMLGYEVELSNDLDLKFDSKGNFIRVDD